MLRAVWNGVVIAEAEADAVLSVDGAVYFPPESVDHTYLRESRTQTTDPVKGLAAHFDVVVEGEVSRNAAWTYAAPHAAAEEIAGYFAFGKGVAIGEAE